MRRSGCSSPPCLSEPSEEEIPSLPVGTASNSLDGHVLSVVLSKVELSIAGQRNLETENKELRREVKRLAAVIASMVASCSAAKVDSGVSTDTTFTSVAAKRADEVSHSSRTTALLAPDSRKELRDMAMASGSSTTVGQQRGVVVDEEGFQTVEKKRRPPKLGRNKSSSVAIVQQRRPSRSLFVSRFHHSTSVDDVKNLVSSAVQGKQLDVKTVENEE